MSAGSENWINIIIDRIDSFDSDIDNAHKTHILLVTTQSDKSYKMSENTHNLLREPQHLDNQKLHHRHGLLGLVGHKLSNSMDENWWSRQTNSSVHRTFTYYQRSQVNVQCWMLFSFIIISKFVFVIIDLLLFSLPLLEVFLWFHGRSHPKKRQMSVYLVVNFYLTFMGCGLPWKYIYLSKTIVSNSILLIKFSRFAMRYDTASATYTLQLKDVQRSDEGRYECQIIVALNNKVTKSLYLKVLEPPVINDNSTRRFVTIISVMSNLINLSYIFGHTK